MSKARLVITAVTVEKRPVSEVARTYGVARSSAWGGQRGPVGPVAVDGGDAGEPFGAARALDRAFGLGHAGTPPVVGGVYGWCLTTIKLL